MNKYKKMQQTSIIKKRDILVGGIKLNYFWKKRMYLKTKFRKEENR